MDFLMFADIGVLEFALKEKEVSLILYNVNIMVGHIT
ncbi:uncharacterized protein METZ01_LOCUS350506 [marine metagenome]|uniref:Uncharacterized protein n=1 Tax=marine metagenome TaxID=408172 RepID=A0A382RK66_9ZZZZ